MIVVMISSQILHNNIFWSTILILLLAIFIGFVISITIYRWGRWIKLSDYTKKKYKVDKVVNFTINIRNDNYRSIDFFRIDGKVIYPFGIRQIKLHLFYQLVNSKNKHELQAVINEIILKRQRNPNIHMPILIEYQHKLLYMWLSVNFFDIKKHKIYGSLLNNDFSIVNDDLATDYRQLVQKQKQVTNKNKLRQIIGKELTQSEPLARLQWRSENFIFKNLWHRFNDSKTQSMTPRRRFDQQKLLTNVILICVKLQETDKTSRYFQMLNKELYTDLFITGHYVTDSIKEVFKKQYINQITVSHLRNVLVYLIKSKPFPHTTINVFKYKHMRKINKLRNGINMRINLMHKTDNLAPVQINSFYFKKLPTSEFINYLLKNIDLFGDTPRITNKRTKKNDQFVYYSREDSEQLQQEFQKHTTNAVKQFMLLKIYYKYAHVYDYDKKCTIGVVPLFVNNKDKNAKTKQITFKSERWLLRQINKHASNFQVLLEKLNLESVITSFGDKNVFLPIDVRMFLTFKNDWVKFFKKNQNFIPCFRKLFTPIANVTEAMNILRAENIVFGAYNFSLIDPINRDLVLNQPMLSFFFASEKSINYMIKFKKYFIPGIVNMEDFKLWNTKVIYPFRNNQFYFCKFREAKANFFLSLDSTSNLLDLPDNKN